MYLNGAAYGEWKFDPTRLMKRVRTVGADLRVLMERLEADSIAVRGTSGVCMAWALAGAGLNVPTILLRKEGENSHGAKFEGLRGHKYKRVLLLDDFTASGTTIAGMASDLLDHAKRMGDGLEIVGVLFHEYSDKYSPKEDGRSLVAYQRQRPFTCQAGTFPVWEYGA